MPYFNIKPRVGDRFDLIIQDDDRVGPFALSYLAEFPAGLKLGGHTVDAQTLFSSFTNGYVFPTEVSNAKVQPRVAFTIKSSSAKGGGTINVYRYVNWLVALGVDVTIYSNDQKPDWTTVSARFVVEQDDAKRYALIDETVIVVYSILELIPLLRYCSTANKRIFHFCQGLEEFHYIRVPKERMLEPIPIFDLLNSLPIGRIAVSRHIESYYLQKYGQTIHTIVNGIDLLTFTPRSPRQISNHVTILTAGNPAQWLKGVPQVVAAVSVLVRRFPEILFEVVNCCGERMPPDQLPDFSTFQIKYSIHFELTPEEMCQMYHRADIYVNGSLYEGFGYPTLEAMACGVPVVHVDNNGLDGIVKHEENCLLVTAEDIGAMANAIQRLIFDQPLRECIIGNGFKIAQNYSQSNQFSMFVEQFQDILGTTFDQARVEAVQRGLRGGATTGPLFSVLIPTYNQAQYLPACLDSLLHQSCDDWEAVIVDDGSGDDTASVLNRYAARDKRFKVYHKQNGGVGSALNVALAHATGEWICWLSSDDMFCPDKLELHRQYFLSNPECSFFHTGYWVLEEATQHIIPFSPPPDFIPPDSLQLLKFFQINYFNGISIAVRRSVFRTVGRFREDLRNGQDFDLWLRITAQFRSVYLPERTCVTRVHSSQGTSLSIHAGIYDSAASCLAFLNSHPFERLLPGLDLSNQMQAVNAVDAVLSILCDATSFINRCGFGSALVERMHEWLDGTDGRALRESIQIKIKDCLARCETMAPPDVQEALSLLLSSSCARYIFQPHSEPEDIIRQISRLALAGHPEAESLNDYLQRRFDQGNRSVKAQPLFTVIVPTYNQAHYLPACLDSLLSQSCSNWEALIINDGSTDATPQVLEKYAQQDERFRVFHKENGGVATALNLGLAQAKGEWICWLSSDDLFEADALEIFMHAISENRDARFFHSEFSELEEETGRIVPSPANRPHLIPGAERQTITFFNGNYVHGISIAVHRSVFSAVGNFNPELRNAQDVDMWLRISAQYRLAHIDKRTCITRIHASAGTFGFPEAGPMDVARACLDFLNNNRFSSLFPFLDLTDENHCAAAVEMTLQTALNLGADMYRGVGFIPALLERLNEWFKAECPDRIQKHLITRLEPLFAGLKGVLPLTIRAALDRLISPLQRNEGYRFHDPYKALVDNYITYLATGNQAAAAVLERYFRLQKGAVEVCLSREIALKLQELKAYQQSGAFPESCHAHAWLDGLQGVEIGPSSHNPFGLDTKSVGIDDDIYAEEQLRLTGCKAKLDVEAHADNIPLPDESEDFVLASHVIEHCPDVISTLLEWYRLIRAGGLLYMIVPHRDASPGDVGRPLTAWEHVLDDFEKQADEHSEPEAGRFGHCHYHVFDDMSMREIVGVIFETRLQLVDCLGVDDKIGNGFTLVYRKTAAIDDSTPWPFWERFRKRRGMTSRPEERSDVFVNIGMVTYNRLEFTRQAIKALLANTGFPYVLSVIDNASTDGTSEYLQEQKRLGAIKNLVLLHENVGVAKASNLAWSLEPDASYYLKLDNDIVVQKSGWLNGMVEVVDALPEAGMVAYNFEPVSYPEYELRGIWSRPKNGSLGGACVLIPRRTHELLGYWCEEYGLYGEEDADYGFRSMQAGLLNVYMLDENVGVHLPAGKAALIDPLTLLSSAGGEEELYADYRNWKDELRRKNVLSGHFAGNLQKYARAGGAIYLETAFAKEWHLRETQKHDAMRAEKISVSIIIPAFNQAALTRNCINALLIGQRDDVEIVVVDNGSSDWTPEYLVSLGSTIKLVSNRSNLGFAKACNQGAEIAQGKYLLFLNNDTEPQPGWLDALLVPAESGAADIVGARLLYPDGTIQHAGVVFDKQGPLHCFKRMPADIGEANRPRYLQAVTGACMLITAQLFQQLGGFDEEYKNGFEDVDLCLSAVHLGYRVYYQPDSVLIHHEESSQGRKLYDEENYARFLSRWLGRWQIDCGLYGMQVSIIIPVFNQLKYTGSCLEKVFATIQQLSGSVEVIVVDNGSTDGTAEYLKTFGKRIQVINHAQNTGFARGCNSGARIAQGRYLLFLNNDTSPCDGWLEAMLQVFDQEQRVGIVGSKLLFPDGSIQHAGVAIVRDPYLAAELSPCHVGYQRSDGPEYSQMREFQAVTAACMMLPAQLFRQVGGFDEGYWNGFEDIDLCFKVHEAGYRVVYQPASVVIHYESKSGTERKEAELQNLQRLQDRWVGKILPEYVRTSLEQVKSLRPEG